MPEIRINGWPLCYADVGGGAETILMSHCYLLDHRCFEAQIEFLSASCRVIAYDQRGHGNSGKPQRGYALDALCSDAVSLIESLGGDPVHWVGLSTGGFVGLHVALQRPDLLRSLVLIDTSADKVGWRGHGRYQIFFSALRRQGFGPLMSPLMKALFGHGFLSDPGRAAEREMWRERIIANDRGAIIEFGKGIARRTDLRGRLKEIRVPTLVVVGEHDASTPLSHARRLAAGIPDTRLAIIAGAGHVCTIEQPQAVSRALGEFLLRRFP